MSGTNCGSRRSSSAFEGLERRQLFAVSLGTNLVKNPGAESNTGATTTSAVVSPSNWSHNDNATAAKYGTVGVFPTTSSPGAKGNTFFAGGPDVESDLFQTIDVSSLASQIDAGKIKFSLSGWLGGTQTQNDNATLFANFSGNSFSQVSVGPVKAAERGNTVKLIQKSTSGTLPAGTRTVQIQLHFERTDGTYNDGYADDVSFVLTQPSANAGSIAGTVFKDVNGNGVKDSGDNGISGITLYNDANNNSVKDSGELTATTDGSGNYKFTGLAAGAYKIRQILQGGTSQTTPANNFGQTVNLTANQAVTGRNFGVKSSSGGGASLAGFTFDDTNKNGKLDSGEAKSSGKTVFLDTNNNGKLDAGEKSTVTSSTGAWSFTGLAAGTYHVRRVFPTGYTYSTTLIDLTLASNDSKNDLLIGSKTV